jgi:hypothetical protein
MKGYHGQIEGYHGQMKEYHGQMKGYPDIPNKHATLGGDFKN